MEHISLFLVVLGISTAIYFLFYHEGSAVRELRKRALGGDVSAMMSMARSAGSTYESVRWYKLAADAGSPHGMFLYADHVSSLPERKELAFRYYLAAAQLGLAEAMSEVANGYASGDGVLKNIGSAAEWRAKAAKAGHRASQIEFARMLFEGVGVDPQPAEGLAWLYLAEHNKAEGAADLIQEFEDIARKYPDAKPNQIILDAQNRVRELLAEFPDARA